SACSIASYDSSARATHRVRDWASAWSLQSRACMKRRSNSTTPNRAYLRLSPSRVSKRCRRLLLRHSHGAFFPHPPKPSQSRNQKHKYDGEPGALAVGGRGDERDEERSDESRRLAGQSIEPVDLRNHRMRRDPRHHRATRRENRPDEHAAE